MSAGPVNTRGLQAALDRALGSARRRLRLRRTLEGAALAFTALLLGGLAAIAVMDAALFEPGVVAATRIGFYGLAAVVLALLVLRPASRPIPDAALAHYVESRAPYLDALILSAVEARSLLAGDADPRSTSPALARSLIARAADECEASPTVSALERTRTRRAGLAAAAIVVIGAGLIAFGPAAWRHGASLLLLPAEDPLTDSPYVVQVTPGDASVLAGEDVRIAATIDGLDLPALTLNVRAEGDNAWTRTTLPRSPETGAFEVFFFDVTASMEYRVEHEVLETPTFRIQVIPRPVAERIDLLYDFPAYTGRAPELVSDGGDIAAVKGTRVEVRVTPTSPVHRGRLVLDGERQLELSPAEDGSLRATLEVERDGRYRVELEAGDYGMAPASPEHAIVAHADSLPTISLLAPGRDVRVTSIEEIAIDARADDDVAVRDLELVLSVNGGADEIVRLGDGSGARPTIEGTLELYLEERGLAPGDLIAYYARTRDAADDPEREVTSDIFFMDVRPFAMTYRRASGAGGASGGGRAGAQAEESLSAQQRSLVVALFKLVRDRGGMDKALFAENVTTLATAQERIRVRVDAIVRRLGARSIVDLNPGYRRMAEELPEAATSMREVEALLAALDVERALPEARQALLHLQRADSAFREAQVAQARQGGGGGNSAASDLSNLFRLEMDRFRSQYEDVRRGNWNPRDPQLDESMRRLKELARRQQRELERARLKGQQGGADPDSQRALAEEVEKLIRELERLTRRRSSEELRGSLKALENAARAMRRSADSGDAAAGADALDRLREARRLLDQEGPARLGRDIDEVLHQADAMTETQQGIAEDVARRQGGAAADPSAAADIAERKRALAGELEEMESRLDRLRQQAGREQQEGTARTLGEAAEALREDRLAERMRRSGERIARGATAGDPAQENAFTRSLRTLRARIGAARGQIGEAEATRLARTLDELRGTMRGLSRDRERLAERARRGPVLPGRGSRADLDPADLSDLRRSLEARAGGIGGMAEALAGDPALKGDLDDLLSALHGARDAEGADAETLARRQAALLTALQNIEQKLRARLNETAPTAPASPRSEPPPSYGAIVHDYYRNLSERSVP